MIEELNSGLAEWLKRDVNPRPPDFKSGALTARPRCLHNYITAMVIHVFTSLSAVQIYRLSDIMIFCVLISSTKTLKRLQYKFEEGEVHVCVMNLILLLTER